LKHLSCKDNIFYWFVIFFLIVNFKLLLKLKKNKNLAD